MNSSGFIGRHRHHFVFTKTKFQVKFHTQNDDFLFDYLCIDADSLQFEGNLRLLAKINTDYFNICMLHA